MIGFKEYLIEAEGDTKYHKYSKNTIEELEELLKHHKEDLEELKASDKRCEDEDEILKDIEEIKNAIAKLKKGDDEETNEKMKSFRKLSEKKKVPTFVEVRVSDAKRALGILNDMFRKKFDTDGSNYYIFPYEDLAYDAMTVFIEQGIDIVSTDHSEAEDFVS